MNYPTIEEVEKADHIQLAKWYRFLESPGMSAAGTAEFDEVMAAESVIMNRLVDRFKEMGGMNSGISKAIGWDKPAN